MGTSGSVRVNSLDASALGAMQDHELRRDLSGKRRRIREVGPLVYSPHGQDLDLKGSYEAHVEGAKRSKGATKLCLHAFVQFPTDLELDHEAERMMLREAVAFVDRHHGGRAVFRARLDRDEAGRHGVDVFYAPRYEKRTKRRSAEWVSLTRFGKELARARFGQRPVVDKNTGEPVTGPDGAPKLMWNDSSYFQGQALQDLWFEHLRDEMGLDWAERGERKLGRDPDRLEPEEYKLQQERAKVERQRQAVVADSLEQHRIIERSGEAAIKARNLMNAKMHEREEASQARVSKLEAEAVRLERSLEGLSAEREQVKALLDRKEALRRSVASAEAREVDLHGRLDAVIQETNEVIRTHNAVQQRAGEARQRAEEAEGRVNDLQAQEGALRASVAALEAQEADLRAEAPVAEDGAENFAVALREVERTTDAAVNGQLTNELLAEAQNTAFHHEDGRQRRFMREDRDDNCVVRFLTAGFQRAADLAAKLGRFTRLDAELRKARQHPEPLAQMKNNLDGLREAVSETLRQLGVADQRPDVGERDAKGDPPPVLELVFTRAARKTKALNAELVARLGYDRGGPGM